MLFISHATPEDNQFAMWLALRLAAEGYPVWCDLTKLIGGEPFWREIESAVRERSCRFLFVLSKHSNANEGTRDELEVAATVRKQLEDDHFIIPLRVDAFSCSNTNIRIHQLNVVDFVPNWMTGFQRLLERLQDDKVQKDERFGIDAVSVWWRQEFGEDEGISETEDIYLTNRLELTSIPSSINLIGLESVVLQLWNRTGRGCHNSNESGFRSEHTNNEAMEQTDLRTHRTPTRLAFADHMHRLVTGDRAPSSPEGAKMLACAHPAFDRPVVLLQNIVEILHRSMPAILLQSTRGFEPHDGCWITGVLVGVDYARRRMVLSAQGFGEKALSRCCVAFSR